MKRGFVEKMNSRVVARGPARFRYVLLSIPQKMMIAFVALDWALPAHSHFLDHQIYIRIRSPALQTQLNR